MAISQTEVLKNCTAVPLTYLPVSDCDLNFNLEYIHTPSTNDNTFQEQMAISHTPDSLKTRALLFQKHQTVILTYWLDP